MAGKTFRSTAFKRAIDTGKVSTVSADDLVKIWRTVEGDEKSISLADLEVGVTAGLVPYTGAISDVNLGDNNLLAESIILNPTPVTIPTAQGSMYFDQDEQTIAAILNGTTQKIGEDAFIQVKNQSGITIPKGTAVRFDGAVGDSSRIKVVPFLADGTYTSMYFVGVTSEEIPNGADGKAYSGGKVRGLNTNAYPIGTILYCSTTVAGGFQTTTPIAPNNIISVAVVITQSATVGTLLIRPQIGSNINNDEGVKIVTPLTGDILQLQASGLWENVPLSVDHNLATTNKQGGDGTNFYHLGEGDFDKVQGIVNPDLSTWVSRIASELNSWQSVTFGNGLFVAVAITGTNRIMTSPDGINWTGVLSPIGLTQLNSITFGNGLFVAVARSGSQLITSPDGINWTVRTASSSLTWNDICYGGGFFIAVAGNRMMRSADSISWTNITVNVSGQWGGIVYGNGLFVAVGNSAGANLIVTSPDGVNWTYRTAPILDDWSSVTFGNGLFVAVAYGGLNRIMTSEDGINWVARLAPALLSWSSVTFGNGIFVAVSGDGITNQIMTSRDAINWVLMVSPEVCIWNDVIYGDGIFVAVASSGINRVMTSIFNKVLNHSQLTLDDGRNPHQTRYEDLLGTAPTGDRNVDGGTWDSVYLPTQNLDGGSL